MTPNSAAQILIYQQLNAQPKKCSWLRNKVQPGKPP